MNRQNRNVAQYVTVLLIGLNLLLTFTCIITKGASTSSSSSTSILTDLKNIRHVGDSILNNNHNNTSSVEVPQQYYYYEYRHQLNPKVHVKFSSETGTVRPNRDYLATTSAMPYSDDERFSEKLNEIHSTTESPTYLEQYYSAVMSPSSSSSSSEDSKSSQSQSSAPRLLRMYAVSGSFDKDQSNNNNEKPNTIVEADEDEEQPSSDNGDDDNDDGSYNNDDDYQHYSNSFSEYTDEELLENVADQDEIHNQYFVKTRPRDVNNYDDSPKSSVYSSNNVALPSSLVENAAFVTQPLQVTTTPSTTTNQHHLQYASDSSDHLENMSAVLTNPNPIYAHQNDELTTTTMHSNYGFVMTPTIASNLIADVTLKFGTTDSTSIPGMPGIDYPILGEIPLTSFDCQKQRYKGFFADVETKCQVWHYCDFTDNHSAFLCPNGTLFSQILLTCDWWHNVKCEESLQLYVLNERLYRYIKAPKLSFPEDYHGPQVDEWLLQQLQLGLLPKMKKKVKDKIVLQANY